MWGDAWVMGVSHSENEIDCNRIVWESLGLLEGLELGIAKALHYIQSLVRERKQLGKS